MRHILLVVVLLLCGCVVYADESYIKGAGGGVVLYEHESVRMASEKVYARLSWDTATVNCSFVFNNEGPTTTLTMGFPEVSYGPNGTRWGRLNGFTSWLDGKPIKTRHMKMPRTDNSYDAWYAKQVRFKAHQTRTVKDRYSQGLEQFQNGRVFRYILRSGDRWKGNIGKATIIVDMSEMFPYFKVTATPSGYSIKDGKLIWIMKNFEPSDDIDVSLEFKPHAYLGGLSGEKAIVEDPEAWIKHGIAMVGLHSMLKMPGLTVEYPKEYECTFKCGEHTLTMKKGSKEALIDGHTKIQLPLAPRFDLQQNLVVPATSIAKTFGMIVTRDEQHNCIIAEPYAK